jgi:hypothetical protein
VQIESEKDFPELCKQFDVWRKRFPMFKHDVHQIEKIINLHIQQHSKIMVLYRQTHSKSHLERAQQEINAINSVLSTVEKIELLSLLSRG